MNISENLMFQQFVFHVNFVKTSSYQQSFKVDYLLLQSWQKGLRTKTFMHHERKIILHQP